MATCPACSGTGSVETGYQPCGACGGRGHRGFIDVACMSCGGSGQSSSRRYSACGRCFGSGQVGSSPASRSPARSRPATRNKTDKTSAAPKASQPAPPWTHLNTAFGGLAYLGGLGYLGSGTQLEGWQLFAAPVIPALILGRLYKWCIAGLVALAAYYVYTQNAAG